MAPTPTRRVTAAPRRALDAVERGRACWSRTPARRRAMIRSSLSGIAVMAMREPRRCRAHRRALPEADARRVPRPARTTSSADGLSGSVTSQPNARSGSYRVTNGGRLPLPHGVVVVAPDESGRRQRRPVVEPLGAEELGREPGRQLDVGHQLPHPLDRRVDQDVDLDGGAVGVEHVASRPALRRRACAARRGRPRARRQQLGHELRGDASLAIDPEGRARRAAPRHLASSSTGSSP